MGGIFDSGNDAQQKSLDLQREEISRNDAMMQQKVAAFTAQRLNIIKAQGTGSYNDRTINT